MLKFANKIFLGFRNCVNLKKAGEVLLQSLFQKEVRGNIINIEFVNFAPDDQG
jgi:hypothetical protein